MISLETERLTIRPIEYAEAEDVAALITADISRWTSQIPWPYTVDDAIGWLTGNDAWARLGIYLQGKLIGTITCPVSDDQEIGFLISEEHRNKGYVTEAVGAVIEFAFDAFGLNFISSSAHPENERSLRVHEKLGFKKYKDAVHYWPNKKKDMPVILLRLTR